MTTMPTRRRVLSTSSTLYLNNLRGRDDDVYQQSFSPFLFRVQKYFSRLYFISFSLNVWADVVIVRLKILQEFMNYKSLISRKKNKTFFFVDLGNQYLKRFFNSFIFTAKKDEWKWKNNWNCSLMDCLLAHSVRFVSLNAFI